MNFDYTYIPFFGYPLFEPMILLTNVLIFMMSVFYFRRLQKFTNIYSRQMSLFILLLGISTLFGAVAHTIHFQLGELFFEVIFFCMNATSLFSIYYCFLGPHSYLNADKKNAQKYIYLVAIWVIVLLVVCLIKGDFLLIKIHAGIVLLYSLVVHFIAARSKVERGNKMIVAGILISFLPIIVHTARWNLHEYFNYKDIAHVIMMVSLYLIYKGVKLNSADLEGRMPEKRGWLFF